MPRISYYAKEYFLSLDKLVKKNKDFTDEYTIIKSGTINNIDHTHVSDIKPPTFIID